MIFQTTAANIIAILLSIFSHGGHITIYKSIANFSQKVFWSSHSQKETNLQNLQTIKRIALFDQKNSFLQSSKYCFLNHKYSQMSFLNDVVFFMYLLYLGQIPRFYFLLIIFIKTEIQAEFDAIFFFNIKM